MAIENERARRLADYVRDQLPQAFETWNWEADDLPGGEARVVVELRAHVRLSAEDVQAALGGVD